MSFKAKKICILCVFFKIKTLINLKLKCIVYMPGSLPKDLQGYLEHVVIYSTTNCSFQETAVTLKKKAGVLR